MSRPYPVIISIEDVKNHLKNGVTRHTDDTSYDPNLGSIMEKYSLTKAEVATLFKDSRLKGTRVHPKKEPAFIIAEDLSETPETPDGDEVQGDDSMLSNSTSTDSSHPIIMGTVGVSD